MIRPNVCSPRYAVFLSVVVTAEAPSSGLRMGEGVPVPEDSVRSVCSVVHVVHFAAQNWQEHPSKCAVSTHTKSRRA